MRNLPNQKDIIKNWKEGLNQPLVSICCVTYNHELYIEQALKGFLMQKTNFVFEILVYDDASTDKTANIIHQYHARYPDIIKPIFQTDNQYSKGFRVNPVFNFPRAKGQYIALCDGDDYWIDPKKLQWQYNYMENHPECSMLFHPAYRFGNNTNKWLGLRNTIKNSFKNFNMSEIILSRGGLYPTSAAFIRSQYVQDIPRWLYEYHAGDYPLLIILAMQGEVVCHNHPMCVYRLHDSGTSQLKKKLPIDGIVKLYNNDICFINKIKQELPDQESALHRTMQLSKYTFLIRLLNQGFYADLPRYFNDGVRLLCKHKCKYIIKLILARQFYSSLLFAISVLKNYS